MKNKALIWTLAITGIILASYVTISLVTKKKEENKKLFSAADIEKVGNIISSIFKKKTPEIADNNQFNTYDSLNNNYDYGYTYTEAVEEV